MLHVAQAFTSVGAPDPRLNVHGQVDYRLASPLSALRNRDPAPVRVKPIPLQLLFHAHTLATISNHPRDLAIIDMAWLGFFFLLRPGEYCFSRPATPFRLRDVNLFVGQQRLDLITCPADDLDCATGASLTFDNQKNRTRGEMLAHGCSGHAFACPIRTLVRRILHLRQHHASLDTPLHTYYHSNRRSVVTPSLLSAHLRVAAAILEPTLGYTPSDVSARALRSGGAMALLCAGVTPDVIRMVGRWRSDAIFRYLHLQALPIMNDLAPRMLSGGDFTLLPSPAPPTVAHAMLATLATPGPPVDPAE
jgi:hypothetical protein